MCVGGGGGGGEGGGRSLFEAAIGYCCFWIVVANNYSVFHFKTSAQAKLLGGLSLRFL